MSDFGSRNLLGAASTRGDHVWLEEHTLEENVVVVKSLDDGSVNFHEDLNSGIDVVVAIGKDFRLNDWDKTVVLADSSVSCQSPCVFLDGEVSWSTTADLKNGSPLGESDSLFVVCLSSLSKVIKTESGGFSFESAWNLSNTLVDLTNINSSS